MLAAQLWKVVVLDTVVIVRVSAVCMCVGLSVSVSVLSYLSKYALPSDFY